jgi:hypothetical protein
MRYLLDAYLEKSPILEERAQEHNFRGSNGHRGSMFNVSSTLLQSDIPFSKGESLFRGRSKAFRKGEQPQGEFKQGEQPQDENDPLPLISKCWIMLSLMPMFD